jgi:hypothetical protein
VAENRGSQTTKQLKMQPAERVENRALSAILPYPQNARSHGEEQIELLANLMQRYGIDQPIVVDEAGIILKGHGRRLAAIKAGFEMFPVVVQHGLTDDDKRALRIADNQVALLAGWDEELIRLEVGDLKLHGFDMPLLGFGDAELASMLDANPGHTDPDDVPEPPAKPVTRLGDLWLLGRHRLLCGDATNAEDVARVLGGVKPHLMVTDPPYGVNYDPHWRERDVASWTKPQSLGVVVNDDESDWEAAFKLFPGDVIYSWHSPGANSIIFHNFIVASGFEIRMQIIWAKPHFPIGRGNYHVQHEPCWYAVRKGATGHWQGSRTQSTLWQIDNASAFKGSRGEGDEQTGHGTQKPIECMKRLPAKCALAWRGADRAARQSDAALWHRPAHRGR